MVDASEHLLLSRAIGPRIGADDGDRRQHQAEIGRALKQAEVADRLVAQVADRAGAGLLLAAGGAEGARVVGNSDAVEGADRDKPSGSGAASASGVCGISPAVCIYLAKPPSIPTKGPRQPLLPRSNSEYACNPGMSSRE